MEGIERVRAAYEAFASGDTAGVLDALHPEVEWDATAALAHKGRFYGHTGAAQYLSTLDGIWESFRLEPKEFVQTAPDEFVVTGRVHGRDRETGLELDARFVHLAKMRDQKVVRLQIFLDREAAMAAAQAGTEAPEARR